jgi:hypothetical protein
LIDPAALWDGHQGADRTRAEELEAAEAGAALDEAERDDLSDLPIRIRAATEVGNGSWAALFGERRGQREGGN